MITSLGIIEFSSIAKGIETADIMIKASSVNVLTLKHICPGKFLVVFGGDVDDVKEAVKSTDGCNKNKIIESVIISNAHEELTSYLKNETSIFKCEIESIGIFETSTVASLLISADSALKASSVKLIKLVIGNGIGGKSYFVITGTVSSVEEAIKFAANSINSKRLIYKTVIPSPDQDIIRNL